MILSVSRRTDIPAFYSKWFFNRIEEGFVVTQNPFNPKQLHKTKITPDVVDCIVFWTKNPKPMLEQLHKLHDYNYYFQFTLTSYGKDIENNVPTKNAEVIKTFKNLSNKIGADRVIWRYDPILINEKYTVEYHLKYFEKLAEELENHTNKCVLSFLDEYKKITTSMKELNIKRPTTKEINYLANNMAKIAKKYNIKIETCSEQIDLKEFCIGNSSCIDKDLIEKTFNISLSCNKDKNQRVECGCYESIDIGMYNTCLNGCKYCYANFSDKVVEKNHKLHNVDSPILVGEIENIKNIKIREVKSSINEQLKIF